MEVESFLESIQEKVVQAMRGRELVSEDWESLYRQKSRCLMLLNIGHFHIPTDTRRIFLLHQATSNLTT